MTSTNNSINTNSQEGEEEQEQISEYSTQPESSMTSDTAPQSINSETVTEEPSETQTSDTAPQSINSETVTEEPSETQISETASATTVTEEPYETQTSETAPQSINSEIVTEEPSETQSYETASATTVTEELSETQTSETAPQSINSETVTEEPNETQSYETTTATTVTEEPSETQTSETAPQSINSETVTEEPTETQTSVTEEPSETQSYETASATIPTEEQITPEELNELDKLERSLRSKILNKRQPCKIIREPVSELYIERVQQKSPLIDNEKEISDILIKNETKHTALYFQLQIESNPLTIGTLPDCDTTTEPVTITQTELIETKYKKNTTKSLLEFLQSQINVEEQKNKFIQLLVHTHLQLLHSITILQTIDPEIIHFNITRETLQYNEKDAVPVLTDFRLAFTKKTLEDKEKSQELFPIYENYSGYPFEIYLLAHLQESTQSLDIETLARNYTNMIQQPEQPEQPEQPIEINHVAYKISEEELKSYYKTWDVYAINEYIYSFMTENKIPLNIPFMTSYKELLISYLKANPKDREPIPVFEEKIKSIFKTVSKNDYKTFVELLIDR